MTLHHASTSQTARLTRGTVLLLAVTCAIAVGTIYFPQAVSPLVADGLHVPPAAAALVVTATQLGYTAGIFLLVPLADRVRHRTLIVTLLALSGLSLLAAGAAPGLAVLVAASALVGTTTVAAQVIAPMAAGLVPENQRGVVTGTLLSGSIGGILLARAFAGILGQSAGWRAPYLVAALLVLLLAAVLARTLPTTTPPSAQPYVAVLAEPLRLLRNEPELRRSAFYQATVFCGFSAVWTAIALLLTGPAYQLGTGAVGLLALVGGGTMVTTPIAGRQVDRHGPDPVNLLALLGVLAAAGVLALGVVRGAVGLAALTAGTLLLDVAMQAGGPTPAPASTTPPRPPRTASPAATTTTSTSRSTEKRHDCVHRRIRAGDRGRMLRPSRTSAGQATARPEALVHLRCPGLVRRGVQKGCRRRVSGG